MMTIINIVLLCFIVFELWYMMVSYKNDWLEEAEINLNLLELNLKECQRHSEELNEAEIEKENISRELLAREKQYNKLLEDYNKLKNKDNRVAEVIKEEKNNG